MQLELIPWSETDRPTKNLLKFRLEQEGFSAWLWNDAPGAVYQPHSHDHDESLWVIKGEITFGVAGRDYRLGPGDRLMLPKGTVHAARAGREGATYLIGERK
jgi:quercetin dioxygenase-like cupin family protein